MRYFCSLRNVLGEEYMMFFFFQGHLPTVVYQQVHRFLTWLGYSPFSLFPRIDLFSYLIVLIPHLVVVGIFYWMVAPFKEPFAKVLAALFWLLPYWGIQSGVFMATITDYHLWLFPAAMITAGLFTRSVQTFSPWKPIYSILLGVFVGLGACTKVTLLVFPGVIFLSNAFTTRPSLRQMLGRIVWIIGAAVITGLAVIILMHQGRVTWALKELYWAVISYRSMIKDQPALYNSYGGRSYEAFLELLSYAPWLLKLYMTLPLALIVATFMCRKQAYAGCLASFAVGALAYHWCLFIRPDAAMHLEAALFSQTAIWAVLLILTRDLSARFVSWTRMGILTCVLLILTNLPSNVRTINAFGKNHREAQMLDDVLEVQKSKGRIAFLAPNNETSPFIDRAIFNGLGPILIGHQLWDEPSPLLHRIFPERDYFTNTYPKTPIDWSRYATVVYTLAHDGDESLWRKQLELIFRIPFSQFPHVQKVKCAGQWVILQSRV